jgi:hypothetical protein
VENQMSDINQGQKMKGITEEDNPRHVMKLLL